MKYRVDRIEEHFAVCECDEKDDMISIDLNEIPFVVEEGDVLILENNCWNKDLIEAEEMHNRIKEKMDLLWE